MATFLFVHGAFQGGWVWSRVADLFQTRGHVVHTPTLADCGYLAQEDHQENDLHVFIDSIHRYIEMEDLKEIILLSHSFAGMISGAIMMQIPERIRHAVFIDAIIPEHQRSFTDLAGETFRLMLDKHRQEDGSVRPWSTPVFGVSGPDTTWFEARLRRFSYKAFNTPFPEIFDPHRIPTSYINCLQTMSPFIQAMAEKAKYHAWPLLTINAGHCPMVSCPRELAQAIIIQTTSGQDCYSFFE